jgi:choline dehydrogenase-like flavoprotein
VPGVNVTSDSDIEQFIRNSASTLFHPAGSCKLGSRSEGGVVDEKLRVYGIKGLRIVDASVIPLLPATHTMTTVYAVAEKVSYPSIIRNPSLTQIGCRLDQARLSDVGTQKAQVGRIQRRVFFYLVDIHLPLNV